MNESVKKFISTDKWKNRAEKLLQDPARIKELFKEFLDIISKPEPFKEMLEELRLLGSLCKDYVTKKYTDIPLVSVVLIVAGLVYVVSPLDIIPDVIPVAGFADDAAIMGYVIKQVNEELAKYKIWRDRLILID